MTKLSSDEQNKQIGYRLRTIRSRAGLNQIEFAESLGVSSRGYENYERGKREAPVALVRSILQSYRPDPIWLLFGGEDGGVIPVKIDFEFVDRMSQALTRQLAALGRCVSQEQRAAILKALYEMRLESGVPTDRDIARFLAVVSSVSE